MAVIGNKLVRPFRCMFEIICVLGSVLCVFASCKTLFYMHRCMIINAIVLLNITLEFMNKLMCKYCNVNVLFYTVLNILSTCKFVFNHANVLFYTL